MQKGFSLLELLIVMATIAVLAAIAIPVMQQAILRANIASMTTDAKAIYVAFKQYYMDNSAYPDDAALQLDTFEPLVGQGYYSGRVSTRLMDDQADGYDSPDDAGINQEFWIELTMKRDPTVRFLVADSDNSPLGGGDYYDGIFLYLNGVLTPLQAVN
jgi:prepilin-type N-terminal cleavage/methylation domain-containing protein